jgi:hypothetical protein
LTIENIEKSSEYVVLIKLNNFEVKELKIKTSSSNVWSSDLDNTASPDLDELTQYHFRAEDATVPFATPYGSDIGGCCVAIELFKVEKTASVLGLASPGETRISRGRLELRGSSLATFVRNGNAEDATGAWFSLSSKAVGDDMNIRLFGSSNDVANEVLQLNVVSASNLAVADIIGSRLLILSLTIKYCIGLI